MMKCSLYRRLFVALLGLAAGLACAASGCGPNDDLFGGARSVASTGTSSAVSGGGGKSSSANNNGGENAGGTAPACLDDCASCGDGECCEQACGDACNCSDGCDCTLSCPAPPCDITCEGEGSSCAADCSNDSQCTCKNAAANCAFSCDQPPCDIKCEGGASCSAVCRDGGCECKGQANCAFDCQGEACAVLCRQADTQCTVNCHSNDCLVECKAGAACVLDCSNAPAGADCSLSNCGGGLKDCPNNVLACRTDCPS